jgi:hypothetical protein
MPKRSAIIRAGTSRASKTTGPPEGWSACAADGAASQDGAEWRSAHVVQVVAQSCVDVQPTRHKFLPRRQPCRSDLVPAAHRTAVSEVRPDLSGPSPGHPSHRTAPVPQGRKRLLSFRSFRVPSERTSRPGTGTGDLGEGCARKQGLLVGVRNRSERQVTLVVPVCRARAARVQLSHVAARLPRAMVRQRRRSPCPSPVYTAVFTRAG